MLHVKHFFEGLAQTYRKVTLKDFAFVSFLVFVFVIPFQKRIEFPTDDSLLNSHFHEYGTIFLYASTVALIFVTLVLLTYFMKSKKRDHFVLSEFALLGFVFLIFLPSLASDNIEVSFFRLSQIFSGLIVIWITLKLFQSNRSKMLILLALVISALYQSLIGILQFTFQSSLGLTFLGESPLSPQIENVAKIVVEDATLIRAYGTFPHANAFGLFMAIGLLSALIFAYYQRHVLQKNILWIGISVITFFILTLGLALSFSRTAWLFAFVLGIFTVFIMYWSLRKSKSRSDKRFLFLLFVAVAQTVVLVGILFPYAQTRFAITDQNGDFAVTNRVLLSDVARETFYAHPIRGVGLGTFTFHIDEFHSGDLAWWQYQPVHSVYHLILAESGVLGFIGFIVIIGFSLYRGLQSWRNDKNAHVLTVGLASMLILVVGIGFFDHHPWDIQQSQYVLWLIIGLMLALDVARETPDDR